MSYKLSIADIDIKQPDGSMQSAQILRSGDGSGGGITEAEADQKYAPKVHNHAELENEVGNINAGLSELNDDLVKVSNRLLNLDGIGTSEFENSDISFSTSSSAPVWRDYGEITGRRIRTPQNKPLKVKKGDIIGLTDYSNMSFKYALQKTDGTYANRVVDTKQDFTIEFDGFLWVTIRYVDESGIVAPVQIENLGKLFFFNKVENLYSEVKNTATDLSYESVYVDELKSRMSKADGVINPFFENGTVSFSNGTISFVNNEIANKRVRTSQEDPLLLEVGDEVYLTETQNKNMNCVYLTEDGVYHTYGANFTRLVVEFKGSYWFYVRYIDESNVKSPIDKRNLSQYFRVKKHTSKLNDISSHVALENHASNILCVMTYNVGGWYEGAYRDADHTETIPASKYNDYMNLHESIIKRYGADIVAWQEYTQNMCKDLKGTIPYADAFISQFYPYIYHGKCSDMESGTYNVITSQREMFDVSVNYYSAHVTNNRNFVKGYCYVNGKKVCIVCTHWENHDDNGEYGNVNTRSNAHELYENVKDEEYLIILADFNCDIRSGSIKEEFLDRGYVASFTNRNNRIDNAIITPNITIKSVVEDMTKDESPFVEIVDHNPHIAYFEIW